ncbi:hypothetical protein [Nocardioides currus]|uniref:DUF559 domain-containing protein n=1 Tax=Nocardioides currus TaxID=2133958 RepID=A0A2R7Z049_9ACTN|nr:hypothetical protein [Nocardioides currus]PUA81924.1 hypothetical protein C7S10_07715 [Nocardioides currus]
MPRPPRTESTLDEVTLARLMARQCGVVSRRQVLWAGGRHDDIRRRVRRREWAVIHPGVYVDHTGPLTREQREWAAVLYYWPAALHRESALTLYGVRHDRSRRAPEAAVQVLVDASRTFTPMTGVEVERVREWRTWLSPYRFPPRVKLEFALLKVASSRDLEGAIAVLADACAQKRTDPEQLAATLTRLNRLPQRSALLEILEDAASGAHSVLERRYLRDVERAHGLPRGTRQVVEQAGAKRVRRDVKYAPQATLVELDGQFGHRDAEDRWADLDRDLAAAMADSITVRLGWAQVLAPCRVAAALAHILTARGLTQRPTPCGPGCEVADDVA